MRTYNLIAGLSLTTGVVVAAAASASTVLTEREAADRARTEGYSLVSKTEQIAGAWDVWASKDGIPYEVKIDAYSGSVIDASPVEEND